LAWGAPDLRGLPSRYLGPEEICNVQIHCTSHVSGVSNEHFAHLMSRVSAMNALAHLMSGCQQRYVVYNVRHVCAATKVNNSLLSTEAQLGVAAEH
jgi:hypothetical protein